MENRETIIEEKDLLDKDGNGYHVRFYDSGNVDITYFLDYHCIDYIFIKIDAKEVFCG